MFVITTNPENYGKTWTHPLWWSGSQVLGASRPREFARYVTRQEAEESLEEIPESTRRFYDLAIALAPRSERTLGGSAYIVRHPGYDLMQDPRR